jgi:hypothetical protein
MGGYIFDFLPRNYLKYDRKKRVCDVTFMTSELEFWLLGDSFLRGYLSIYYIDKK